MLLDWSELDQSDKSTLLVLNYLNSLYQSLQSISTVKLVLLQPQLTKDLITLLTPANSTPLPGRPITHLIPRILLLLLHRGDQKLVFDIAQSLINLSSTTTTPLHHNNQFRLAAAYCLAHFWEQWGNQIMSLSLEIILSSTRTFKATSLPVNLRVAALLTLRKALVVGGKSLSDQLVKDTIKALKAGLGDRAGAVVRECAECLIVLGSTTPAFSSLSEIDNVLTPALRALELVDPTTRRSLVKFISYLLASTQIEGSAIVLPPKKAKKEGDEEEDVYPTIGAPAVSEGKLSTLLSPPAMLALVSTLYNKFSTTRSHRNALLQVYAKLFVELGEDYIQRFYVPILVHLFEEIGCGPAAGHAWSGWNLKSAERIEPSKAHFEALTARKSVGILLRDVLGGRLLSEMGQMMAMRELGSVYLKKWPGLLPSSPSPPSKQILVMALDELTGLLRSLGTAPSNVLEIIYDPLLRLVGHTSLSVQVAAAGALRELCSIAPIRLAGSIVLGLELLNKDLASLQVVTPSSSSSSTASTLTAKEGTNGVNRRAIGNALALAALINLIPHQPLYVSFDISTKCMSLSIQLLRQSSSHDLPISAIEIQVAWILIGALMSLGPNFVRLHLPQLLILWRNALPKPSAKETSAATIRGEREWGWLLHIRESALGSILNFLKHNGIGIEEGKMGGLVDEDVGRRIVLLLGHAIGFLNSFHSIHSGTLTELIPSIGNDQLNLLDREALFRRRLLQCFLAIKQNSVTRIYQVQLLTSSVTNFSDPEKYFGESMAQAGINFGGNSSAEVWLQGDGIGFGVTGLVGDLFGFILEEEEEEEGGKELKGVDLNRDFTEVRLERLLREPIPRSFEHDFIHLFKRLATSSSSSSARLIRPPPPLFTALVDCSIQLFSLYFPLQEAPNQSALLQQMINNLRSNKLDKNPGRRMAILINCLGGILGTLRWIERMGTKKGIDLGVASLMREIIKEGLLSPDALLRRISAEALGKLTNLAGNIFMNSQIQFLVNQVVSSIEPNARAGCALGFGEIYSNVGALASGSQNLKIIVEVLLSLSGDPHPLVHYYALQALAQVIGSASLSYAPFTNPTLGMITKLYLSESHEPEGGSSGSVNLRGNLPAYQVMCQVLNELIGVMGPELNESEKVKNLILLLLKEFLQETDEGIKVEAIKAIQRFLIFAPATPSLDLNFWVTTLRTQINSSREALKIAAVNGVYQLVQRDALMMSKLGGDELVSELFGLLDDDPGIGGVRDTIISWLRQTGDGNPSGWIDLCQRIMSRSNAAQSASIEMGVTTIEGGGISFIDEESQGLGLEKEGEGDRNRFGVGGKKLRTTSRWRTQLFALQCLHEIFLTVLKSGRREHFDIARARGLRIGRRGLLISRVPDLIKMAFTASTAQVMEIRLEGLVVLRDVIENFSRSQDLDFEEALLLDQYQAPIAAALTPAFAADSYPEVLASAVQVCAVFVGSGVVKEIEKMGRILKLLTGALESCRESDMSSLGDVKDLSSTASVMLKTSIFAAWAQFQTASIRQPYLVEVIRPHLPLLCPFWVASLREYARVRTDPDATSSDAGAGGAAFDSVYSGLSRETALPFYERSWPQMLHAVATLLRTNDVHMLRALDGQDTNPAQALAPPVVVPRTAPSLFFWVLFGLSFEALCTTPPKSGTTTPAQVQAIALEALVGLIRPEVSGDALLKTSLLDELCNLCYRLAITEGAGIKMRVMGIVLQLGQTFAVVKGNGISDAERTLEESRQTQCLRVATCVLQESIPSVNSRSARVTAITAPAHIALLRSAFSAFADLADLHPMPKREDLYSIALHFYSQLLKDETSEVDLVGPTLPVLKALCERAFHARNGTLETLPRVINGMLSACLQNVDDMRTRQGPTATLKTKNNLLAAVLLLTSLPATVKIGRAVVEHTCALVTQAALSGEGETAVIALHCLTSLLSAASRGSGVVQSCVGHLLPGLIEFIARAAETGDSAGDARLTTLGEVLKCLVAVLSGVVDAQRTRALSILIPVLILLLCAPETTPIPPPSHDMALVHLLNLASSYSTAFKEVTLILSEEQRKVLEGSIRARVGKGSKREEERKEAPKIELRSFGSK